MSSLKNGPYECVLSIQLKIGMKKIQSWGQPHGWGQAQKNVSGLHTKIFLWEQWIIHHLDLLSALELFGEKQPGLLFHAHCTLLILGKYIWKTNITCLVFIPLVHLKIQRPDIKKIKLNWKRLPGSQNVCKMKAYLLDALAQPTSILTLSVQCYWSWATLVYWMVF